MRQTFDTARPDPHPVARATPGLDPNHIIADVLKLVFDALRSSAANADDTDKRPDANDDPEHRQGRAHPVPEQRSERFPENGFERHIF